MSDKVQELFNSILNGSEAVCRNGILVHTDKAEKMVQGKTISEASELLDIDTIAIYELLGCGTDTFYYVVNVDKADFDEEMYNKLKRDWEIEW